MAITSTPRQLWLLLKMQLTMNKNKTSLIAASITVPVVFALVLLTATLISINFDSGQYIQSMTWYPKLPLCGLGKIGVYPEDHPIAKDLLALYPPIDPFVNPRSFSAFTTAIKGDFSKECTDKLYKFDSGNYGSTLIGCIDFSKIPTTPKPFPTTHPTSTNVLQYDMFVQTRAPIMSPLNSGDFYSLEASISYSHPSYCFPPYVTAVNNVASIGILRHHGLYTADPPDPSQLAVQDAVIDASYDENDIPRDNYAVSEHFQQQLQDYKNHKAILEEQQDPTQTAPTPPHNNLPSHFGPLGNVDLKLWPNPNSYPDYSNTYYSALAHQSLTIIFFIPLFFFFLLPFTEAKQFGYTAQLLINGIHNYNILVSTLLLSLTVGLPTMFIYAWISLKPFDHILPLSSMIVFYLIYVLAAISFCALIGSIVTHTRPASQLLIGLCGIFAFIGFFIEDFPHWLSYALSPFCFQFTYSLAWKTFLLYITHDQTLHFDHYASSLYGYSYATATALLVTNIILTSALALYFQQIIPTEGSVAKPWNFIFYPQAWFSPDRSTRSLEKGNGILEYHAVDSSGFFQRKSSDDQDDHRRRPIRPNTDLKTRSYKRKNDINNMNSIQGEYSQQIDSDPEDTLDDLERAEDFVSENERNIVENDIAKLEYNEESDENIGYIEPLHPTQPLTEYERENVTISFKNVRKSFTALDGGNIHVNHAIKRLNLDISRQIVFLTGKNGSGKTLLFEMILGLTPPSSGTIRVQLPTSNVNIDGNIVDHRMQGAAGRGGGGGGGNTASDYGQYIDPFATTTTSNDPFAPNSDTTQIPTANVQSDSHNYPNPLPSLQTTDISSNENEFVILNNQLSAQQFQHRPLYGYSSQTNAGLYPDFTPTEQLRYISELMQMSSLDSDDYLAPHQVDQLIDDIARCLGINTPAIMNSSIENLPLGIQKLVSIACACIHSPHIILLDSPFTYLDLQSQRHVWDLLQLLKTMGSSVIIADHSVHDVELADKIGVLSNGNLLLYGEPKWLKQQYRAGYSLIIEKDVKDAYSDHITNHATIGGSAVHVERGPNSDSDPAFANEEDKHIGDFSSASASGAAPQISTKNQLKEFDAMNKVVESVGSSLVVSEKGESEEDLLTTSLGKSIYHTLRNNPKFSHLITLLQDDVHEMYWAITMQPISSSSSSETSSHQLIPQFLSYLEAQKHALGIKSMQLSMKTMEDIFFAANQMRSTLVRSTNSNSFSALQEAIAEGTLPDIVYNLEKKHFEERQKARRRMEIARRFETNLDDNNSTNIRTAVRFESDQFTAQTDDVNVVDDVYSDETLQSGHRGQFDRTSRGDSAGEYTNMNTTLDLWTFSHKQTQESSLLPQVAGYLRNEYTILWQTPTKWMFLLFVPVIIVIAVFLTSPRSVFLFNSSPPLPLTLAGLPSSNLVEYGLSRPVPSNPFPAPTGHSMHFMTDLLNPSYIITPEEQDKIPNDILQILYQRDTHFTRLKENPRIQQVGKQFSENELITANVFTSAAGNYDYHNPRSLGFLMSANSTYDASMSTFNDLKAAIYANATALPLAYALNNRIMETLYNFAVKYKTTDGQSISSTASMMLLPTMTQIYAQQDISLNLGYSTVLGFLLTLGMSAYPIIQTYYYARDRASGWDDVCRIHGLYTISKWASRAIYDLSIYIGTIIILSLGVTLSGYGSIARDLFESQHYDVSVFAHFFVLLLVTGIQFLLFMHALSYFIKDPIRAQTYCMMALFAPPLVLLLMMITLVIPFVSIFCFFIGALCPTVLIMAGVLYSHQLPQAIWLLIGVSIMSSCLLTIFAVLAAVTETFNMDTIFGAPTPSAIVQDGDQSHPLRHVYVSESAQIEAQNVTTVYNKNTHPIRAMGLYKKYGFLAAVNDVSFGVEKGSLLTLVGPRGCGRTSILQLLLNLEKCTPTSDNRIHSGDICGQSTQSKAIEHVFHDEGIGYIPQTNDHLHNQLTARQILTYMSTLRGLDSDIGDAYIHYLLAVSGLSKVADKRVKSYTDGMKTRLNVICALIGNPQILIADDFTTNCDPLSAKHIRQLIHHTGKQRTTLLSTNDVADVEALGGRVALVSHGLITAVGSVDQLSRTLGAFYSIIVTTQPQSEESGINLLTSAFNSHPNVEAFNTQQSSTLDSSPSSLQDFAEDGIAQNISNIPQNPPIKLIETHQNTIAFHINQNYFSLSGIFEILFSLQLENPTIIQSYTVSHLGLSDVIRASVRQTALSHQRTALPYNIAPTTVDYEDEPEYTNNIEVVLDTTLTTSAGQAIASSPSFAHNSGGAYRGGHYD